MPRLTSTRSVLAVDVAGSVRSGVGAVLLAAESPGRPWSVLADVRTGLPGGSDERDGGDAAAAFVFGDGAPVLAEIVAEASTTAEFLDRWRLPGAPASHVWEERFGEHAYVPLADAAFADALKQARSDADRGRRAGGGRPARPCGAGLRRRCRRRPRSPTT